MGHDGTGALGLLSGGLDSQLAICVLRAQGIDVHAVVFDSPFYSPEAAIRAARALDVPLHVVDFTSDIIALLREAPHGFGKCMNPCIDCHARMLRRAGELMAREHCRFLFTGEVLNQRPMSQNRPNLGIVERDSTHAGFVLRPLSAQLLPETEPERRGWVDRTRLLALSGRGRKPQFALARAYGLVDYPSPAGGCRLTEPNYCARLRELVAHEGLGDLNAVALLRHGRHFRLPSGRRYVLGRDAADNAAIEALARPDDVLLAPRDVGGPTGLLPGGGVTGADIELAAAICLRYARRAEGGGAHVRVRRGQACEDVATAALPEETAQACRI